MQIQLTAVYKKVKNGYIGYVAELPGANTQGETLEETKENLKEAIELVLEANKILSEEELKDEEILKEPFCFVTA
jgi:predicted RNase H-like HicB family nuclease